MSGEDQGSDEPSTVPRVKKERISIADKLRGLELPDELRMKVRMIAEAQGKSESEVMTELVEKGLSTSDQDIAYTILRRKVLSSLTLKEAQQVMKEIGETFNTWSATPRPQQQFVPQPSTQQPPQPREERDEFAEIMGKVEKDALKGLPPVTMSPQQTGQAGQQTALGQVLLYNLGKYALGKLLENPSIGQAIGKVIAEKGGGFIDDLKKMFEQEGA